MFFCRISSGFYVFSLFLRNNILQGKPYIELLFYYMRKHNIYKKIVYFIIRNDNILKFYYDNNRIKMIIKMCKW